VQHLGQLESQIMERLWSMDRAVSVRDVVEDLQQERRIAYTTVMTVLDNLHRKGLVSRAKDGRAYSYRPVRSREEHTAALMEEILHSSEDRGTTLLHFVGQMSPEEVARLRAVLDRLGDPEARR
jgi:predicted transcriptional regulator